MGASLIPPSNQNFVVCTSTTRPVGFEGQTIYETDTDLHYQYLSGVWQEWAIPIPHTESFSTTVTVSATTSATFVAFANPVEISNFIKYRSDTKLVMVYNGSLYNDTGLGQAEVAVNVDGVNYVVVNGFSNTVPSSGVRTPTPAAGTYTIGLRRRRVNAAGNVFDGPTADSRNAITVTETF